MTFRERLSLIGTPPPTPLTLASSLRVDPGRGVLVAPQNRRAPRAGRKLSKRRDTRKYVQCISTWVRWRSQAAAGNAALRRLLRTMDRWCRRGIETAFRDDLLRCLAKLAHGVDSAQGSIGSVAMKMRARRGVDALAPENVVVMSLTTIVNIAGAVWKQQHRERAARRSHSLLRLPTQARGGRAPWAHFQFSGRAPSSLSKYHASSACGKPAVF